LACAGLSIQGHSAAPGVFAAGMTPESKEIVAKTVSSSSQVTLPSENIQKAIENGAADLVAICREPLDQPGIVL